MDEALHILEEFGLSPAQAAIYRTLLRHPQLPAQLSRSTGLHRRSIIATLRILATRGLVSKQREGTYTAAPLSHIQRSLEQRRALLLDHLPRLSAQYESTKDTQIVNLLRGVEGVKAILADELLKGKPILVLFGRALSAEYQQHLEVFDQLRVKQGIPLSLIGATPDAGKHRPLCEARFLREFHAPMEIHVYANKVGIILWDDEPIAVSIKRDEITESWERYFRWLWGLAKPKPRLLRT